MSKRIHDLFEKHEGEFLNFDRVENKRSSRPDVHAFVLLGELFPSTTDIVGSAEHDEIWISVESEDIEKLTEDQIIELHRCGVRYDSNYESLAMFV